MKDRMQYRDYSGSVHYNDEDSVFYGKIEDIRSLVSYEGEDIDSLQASFEEAVDDYLELCQRKGIKPEHPLAGSFNVQTGS
jgi:predicted HicB family RNase H-like nuclease